jgi:hypothetical protein
LTGPVAAPEVSALVEPFKQIGRTSYGTVLIDPASVKLDTDRDGGVIAGMVVKVKLLKPQKGTHAVVNAVIFSCAAEAAMVISSTSLGAKDEIIETSDRKSTIPWVKGSDSATNVIMEKLCKGQKKPSPPGTLTT